MDLKVYLRPILKWLWLIGLASLVSALSSYLVTRQQPPIYQARATLVIGRSVFDPNPTSADFWLGQQLAGFYADLARREPVRNATMEALGITWLPDYIAQPVPNSQLIEIVVTDTSAQRAQAVANELANQLILKSPANSQSQEQGHQEFVNQQLHNLETEIKNTQDEISKKQDELGGLFSARQIADAQADIDALGTKLTTLQTNYAALLASSERGATNTLSIIEQASLPAWPVGPQKGIMVLLTTVIGAVLAAGGAYLIEFLDDTLKDPDEFTRVAPYPIIGYIAEVRESENDATYVAKKPRSVVAEAYRTLRANLEFAAVDKPLKTILVTSTGVAEGKTSVAINLAVVMAQGGKKVILIDADLRRPSIFRRLGLSNNKGLSDLFRGQLELEEAYTPWEIEKIRIIMSGPPPPNPADLLGSKRMDNILERLKQEADIIILDGPPFLVADAGILASKVDGALLVFRHGYTRREVARNVSKQLARIGANVIGIAINRVPRSGISLYGNYGYGSEGYYSAGFDDEKGIKKARINPIPELTRNIQVWFSDRTKNVRRGLNKQKNGTKPVVLEEEQSNVLADVPSEVQETTLESPVPESEKAESDSHAQSDTQPEEEPLPNISPTPVVANTVPVAEGMPEKTIVEPTIVNSPVLSPEVTLPKRPRRSKNT